MTTASVHPLIAELRKLRLAQGWTLDDLAWRISVGRSALSAYERGVRRPPIEAVEAYAETLGYELVLRRQVFEEGEVTPERAAHNRAVLARALKTTDDYEPGEVERVPS